MGNSSSSATSSSIPCFPFLPVGSRYEKEGPYVPVVEEDQVSHPDGTSKNGGAPRNQKQQLQAEGEGRSSGEEEEKYNDDTREQQPTTESKNANDNGTAIVVSTGRELMRLNSFDKLNIAFQNLMNPSAEAQQPEPPKPRSPPKPKHMLWGCHTVEEHYQYIKEACSKIKDKKGEEGLALLGLEFRWVHCTNRKCECCCCDDKVLLSSATSFSSTTSSRDDVDFDFDNDDDYGYHSHEPESYMVPIGGGGGGGDWGGHDDEQSRPQQHQLKRESEEVMEQDGHQPSPSGGGEGHEGGFMAPIGKPLNDHPLLSKSALDLLALRQEMMESSDTKTKRISRVMSAASMFSLATHHTYTSSEGDGGRSDDAAEADDIEQEVCTMRLYHNPTGELITERNFEDYIAKGRMYDEVARLCMDVAQDAMIEAGDLEWITLCGGGEDQEDNEERIPIRALVSHNNRLDDRPDNTLLIVTGKGEVRAGIFSRRHLITSGIEISTALPFIREGLRRRMRIVILDPNARGWKNGLQTFHTSIEKLFMENNGGSSSIYALAHSMAGSQLVRFLMDKTKPPEATKEDTVKDTNGNNNTAENGDCPLLQRIKGLAFTDANHNVGWVKMKSDYLPILNLIEGSQSLYIKSHKVHEDAKVLGDVHHDCDFWKRRFGKVRTIWAGTNEHALTNYAARWYIWDHFDQLLDTDDISDDVNNEDGEEQGDFATANYNQEDNNGEDDEGAPSF